MTQKQKLDFELFWVLLSKFKSAQSELSAFLNSTPASFQEAAKHLMMGPKEKVKAYIAGQMDYEPSKDAKKYMKELKIAAEKMKERVGAGK